ncbi:hypothetical protein Tco_1114175 [Tanacetum coccineum]|uniref:Reverse transcriptase Ty1/copia-type domain-containing protein n=1 Tax=Tanacetum coccineum TaxID=301880 RepID=A0ABQ5IUB2_9ASTR
MGELTFFLGLQVTQKDDGIFISHDKYVDEILKKLGFFTLKSQQLHPLETSKPLLSRDAKLKKVDVPLIITRKSTTGGFQFLGRRLISWQCKKQTIVANSTTMQSISSAASCCKQLLLIQKANADYGYKLHEYQEFSIDKESTHLP